MYLLVRRSQFEFKNDDRPAINGGRSPVHGRRPARRSRCNRGLVEDLLGRTRAMKCGGAIVSVRRDRRRRRRDVVGVLLVVVCDAADDDGSWERARDEGRSAP